MIYVRQIDPYAYVCCQTPEPVKKSKKSKKEKKEPAVDVPPVVTEPPKAEPVVEEAPVTKPVATEAATLAVADDVRSTKKSPKKKKKAAVR